MRNPGKLPALFIHMYVQVDHLLPSKNDTFESEKFDSFKMALVNISDFIDQEKINYDFTDAYSEMDRDRLVHPNSKDSTEL